MKTKIHPINTSLLIVFTISIIAIASCVEEYWPELNGEYEDLLVVDGKITNEAGPYTITLSRSSSLLEPAHHPLPQAIVIINDNQGNSETLTETSPGIYHTSVGGIQGVVGRRYKLTIQIGNKTYESKYEEILEPIDIGTISCKKENKLVNEITEEYKDGYQFYLTTLMNVNIDHENYQYWEVEETYEYHAPYPREYIYNEKGLAEYPYPFETFYCWPTNIIKDRFIQSTENLNLTQSGTSELALHFIRLGDEKLRIKYSAQAKQYTISEEAYSFHKALEEMNSAEDKLYMSQPYQIRGNLVNIDDPEEAILGYFLTAGVSRSQHIFTPSTFIDSPDAILWSRDNCLTEVPDPCCNDFPTWEEVLAASTPDEWPLYLGHTLAANLRDLIPFKIIFMVYDQPHCIDCRIINPGLLTTTQNSTTTQKPDFWVD